MGINLHQKEQIEISIDFLIDLPLTENALKQTIDELFLALTCEEVSEENQFAKLRRILDKPENYLTHLEDTTSNNDVLTIQDVQTYIIEFISKKISEANKSIKSDAIRWDENLILKKYITEERKPFVTNNHSQENPETALPAWQICTMECGSVFSAFLSTETKLPINSTYYWHMLDDETKAFFSHTGNRDSIPFLPWIYLNINTQKIAGRNWADALPLVPLFLADEDGLRYRFFATDSDQDKFIDGILVKGLQKAKQLTSLYILTIMHQRHLLQHRDIIRDKLNHAGNLIPDLNLNEACQTVITHQYYCDGLIEGRFEIDDFTRITNQQANFLIHPSIISLLTHEIISLEAVKELIDAGFRVITNPFYYLSLKTKQMNWHDLSNLSDMQAKILLNPPIIHLIRNKKLTISLAKRFSNYMLLLFSNSFYQMKLSQEIVDWEKIISLSESDVMLLLSPPVMRFVYSCYDELGDYQLGKVLTCLPSIKRLLDSRQLGALVRQQKVSLSAALSLSTQSKNEIERHPFLAHWIQANDFNISIMEKNPIRKISQQTTTILTKRIQAILNQHPLIVRQSIHHHFVYDNVDFIYQDIATIATYQQKEVLELLKPIFINIFALIKHKLIQLITTESHSEPAKLRHYLLEKIDKTTKKPSNDPMYWETEFTQFLKDVAALRAKIKDYSGSTTFFRTRTPIDSVLNDCESILMLSGLTQANRMTLQHGI